MAWRLEIKTRRGWVEWDEERKPRMSKARYEAALLRCSPWLRTREYRIVQFDGPPHKVLFTLSVPLTPALARFGK